MHNTVQTRRKSSGESNRNLCYVVGEKKKIKGGRVPVGGGKVFSLLDRGGV